LPRVGGAVEQQLITGHWITKNKGEVGQKLIKGGQGPQWGRGATGKRMAPFKTRIQYKN